MLKIVYIKPDTSKKNIHGFYNNSKKRKVSSCKFQIYQSSIESSPKMAED